jgi:hypothetical protein
MYLATMHTGHFEFRAVGNSESEAIELMREAWDRHTERDGGWPWEFMSDSVSVEFLRLGDVYRDSNLIRNMNKPSPHWLDD